MVSCGGTLIKVVLGVFNFLGLALGALVIYLGARIFQFNADANIQAILNTNLSTGALVVVIFGAAIALISLTGFLGACCESSALLNVYGFIVLVLLVLQCVGVYFNYKVQSEYLDSFETGMKKAIDDTFNGATPNAGLGYALQQIQLNLQCCGWNGPSDYTKSSEVPASCCAETVNTVDSLKTCSRAAIKYSVGCKDASAVSFLKSALSISGYLLILVEIVLILAACCLARDIARYQPVSTY